MKITIANYEKYALDYIEGNLSPNLQQAMQQFLAKNPTIAAEFEGLEDLILVPDETIVYTGKASLKREAEVIALPSSRRRTIMRIALVAAALMGVFILGQQLFERTATETIPMVEERDSLEKENTALVKEAKLTDMTHKEEIVTNESDNVTTLEQEKNIATAKHTAPSPSPLLSPKTKTIKTFNKKKLKPIPRIEEAVAVEIPTRIVPEVNKQAIEKATIVKKAPNTPVVSPNSVEEPQNISIPQEELSEPVVLEEAVENTQPDELEEKEELASASQQNVKSTRKKVRRVAFFPKFKEKFSPEALRAALLPEAVSSDSK